MKKLSESDSGSSDLNARHNLLSCSQKEGETLEQYMNTLQKLGKGCKFKAVSAAKNRNDYIRDVFISGMSSDSIRECLLKRKILTFEDAFAQAQSLEQAQNLIESHLSLHSSTKSTFEDNLMKNQEDEDYCSVPERDSSLMEEEDNKPDISLESCEHAQISESFESAMNQCESETNFDPEDNFEDLVKEENEYCDVEIEFNPLDASETEENTGEILNSQETVESEQYFDSENGTVEFVTSNDFNQEEIFFTDQNQLENVDEDLINNKRGANKKSFKCDICDASFTRKFSLKYHKRKHMNDDTYNPSSGLPENLGQENLICSFCSESFSNINDLLSHSFSHSDGQEFPCVYCTKIFVSDYSLKRHFASHTDPKKHLCPICSRGFRRRYDLNRHIKIHDVTRISTDDPSPTAFRDKTILNIRSKASEKEFTCSTCSKTFTSIYKLTKHLATHTVEKQFSCYLCSETFHNEYTLSKHIALHNTVERDFTCVLCAKTFCDEFNLTLHLRLHSEGEQFTCTECFQSFDSRKDLKCHYKLHDGVKEFICTVCDKKCPDKRSLSRHMQSHGKSKRFRCEICSKSFSEKYNLVRHSKLMHDVTDDEGRTCSICLKRFGDRHGLKRHMRIHTGEKPFKCEICPRAFNEKSKLKSHMNTHKG